MQTVYENTWMFMAIADKAIVKCVYIHTRGTSSLIRALVDVNQNLHHAYIIHCCVKYLICQHDSVVPKMMAYTCLTREKKRAF